MVFLYFPVYLHCRSLPKAAEPRLNTYGTKLSTKTPLGFLSISFIRLFPETVSKVPRDAEQLLVLLIFVPLYPNHLNDVEVSATRSGCIYLGPSKVLATRNSDPGDMEKQSGLLVLLSGGGPRVT